MHGVPSGSCIGLARLWCSDSRLCTRITIPPQWILKRQNHLHGHRAPPAPAPPPGTAVRCSLPAVCHSYRASTGRRLRLRQAALPPDSGVGQTAAGPAPEPPSGSVTDWHSLWQRLRS